MSRTTIPKIFMAGGAVGFGYYLVMRQYWFPNPGKTTAVQNIEDRFSSGGGSPTHTPAVATRRGSSTDNEPAHGSQGIGSKKFADDHSDQHSEGTGIWPKKFYEQQYNDPKGK